MSVDPERLREALSEPAPVTVTITPDLTAFDRIRDLIDRSLLGTPGARQLQQRTSDEELEHIRNLTERERGSTP